MICVVFVISIFSDDKFVFVSFDNEVVYCLCLILVYLYSCIGVDKDKMVGSELLVIKVGIKVIIDEG